LDVAITSTIKSQSQYDKLLVVDGDGERECFLFLWLLVWLQVMSMLNFYDRQRSIFLWLLLWVSIVWCVAVVWIFLVGHQSRARRV
jgi:hypothetical protein